MPLNKGHFKPIDISGLKVGRLTVIERKGKNKHGQYMWSAECECGTVKEYVGSALKRGEVKSCGCLQKERTHKRFFIDLTGKKFGEWTALEPLIGYSKHEIYWLCRCSCDSEMPVKGGSLRSGKSKRCRECGWKHERGQAYSLDWRKTGEYKKWRSAVFERDNHTCKTCGITDADSRIHAHHVFPASDYPHMIYHIDNGITLCEKCHKRIHGKDGD